MTAVLALLLFLWAGSPGPQPAPRPAPQFHLHRSYPRELPARRRVVIIALSLGSFFAVLFYAGRKFQHALAERDQPEDRPPDEMP